jgi:hypothetical protein
MHGHFDVQNQNDDVEVESGIGLVGIHTGIGMVVPVEKIIETIYQPDLHARRQQVMDRVREQESKKD